MAQDSGAAVKGDDALPMAERLPPILDRDAAMALATAWRVHASCACEIDGSEVTRVGQTGLQLLLSARATAQASGADLRLVNVSAELERAVALAGLDALLPCEPAR